MPEPSFHFLLIVVREKREEGLEKLIRVDLCYSRKNLGNNETDLKDWLARDNNAEPFQSFYEIIIREKHHILVIPCLGVTSLETHQAILKIMFPKEGFKILREENLESLGLEYFYLQKLLDLGKSGGGLYVKKSGTREVSRYLTFLK